MNKAVFLDRDGVINELIYHEEHGLLDSPGTDTQMKVFPWAGKAINRLQSNNFKTILVSNQPGIAKGHFNRETFDKIRKKMITELAKEKAALDAEYYCFHHPQAKVNELRISCECRKPGNGLLVQASQAFDIDMASSWFVGDGLTDIQAGKTAGCKTILVGRMKCELCSLMEEMDARPDAVAANLLEAVYTILDNDV